VSYRAKGEDDVVQLPFKIVAHQPNYELGSSKENGEKH
jgi:hypothetical protein